MKHDSILRRNNYKLQKSYISYCLNLSNISSEIWKKKWKQKILQRDKMLHELKNIETKYKGFNDLHLKVDLKQFEETVNLGDTPIKFMDHSAALRETLSFNQPCTGAKVVMDQQQTFSYQAKILIVN
jgi:hypothetical protein